MLLKASHPTADNRALGQRVMAFYTAWKDWDKDRAIEECLDDFKLASTQRQASKVARLGALFVQALDPSKPEDIKRAKKLLPFLKMPQYVYVLRSYINVYIKSNKTREGERLNTLLGLCGQRYQDI